MLISVIIPAVDEAGVIEACLRQFEDADDAEVIVVDGGSTDRTEEIVSGVGNARWLLSPGPGRARQMNRGAALAAGDVFLFLHADTLLPPNGLGTIRSVMLDTEAVGGRFRLGFTESSIVFRLIGWLSTLRSLHLGITYGDQAIFARREAFGSVDGYPDRLIFEDSEFFTQLSGQGRVVLVDAPVRTSTRRWRRSGVLRTVLLMWGLRLLYALNVGDRRLSRWYRHVR